MGTLRNAWEKGGLQNLWGSITVQVKAMMQVSDQHSITAPGGWGLGIWDLRVVEKDKADKFRQG